MTLSSSYKSGTITVSAGGTQVIGTGTNWTGFGVREGDIIWAGGIDVAVASVEGPTALTLAFPWAGPALSGSTYEIRPTPDASRVLTASREAIASLETIQGDLYASANVYSTIAEGLAATATGSQFQVAQGTEIVRFVKTAPGFATELARYMTAPGVTAAVAQATAKDAALTLAIRDGAVLPLTNIGGTGDAISADLQATMIAAGITTLSAIAEVEYIPVAGNTLTDPTLTVAGVTYTIKDFDGGVWPAGGFVANRIYKLRRRGMTLRVTSGNLSRTDVAAQISIEATARAAGDTASRDRANHSGVQPITTVDGLQPALDAEAQARTNATRKTGVIPLAGVAGTATQITATIPTDLGFTDGMSMHFTPAVDSPGTAVSLSIGGSPGYLIKTASGLTPAAGDLKAGRPVILKRIGSTIYILGTVPSEIEARINADKTAVTVLTAASAAGARSLNAYMTPHRLSLNPGGEGGIITGVPADAVAPPVAANVVGEAVGADLRQTYRDASGNSWWRIYASGAWGLWQAGSPGAVTVNGSGLSAGRRDMNTLVAPATVLAFDGSTIIASGPDGNQLYSGRLVVEALAGNVRQSFYPAGSSVPFIRWIIGGVLGSWTRSVPGLTGDQVVWLGDSITHGVGASVAAQTGYAAVASRRLGCGWTKLGTAGAQMSSTTAVQQAQKDGSFVEAVAAHSAAIVAASHVIVAYGTNDFNRATVLGTLSDTSRATFYGAMDEGYRALLSANPMARVVFVTPLYRSISATDGAENLTANAVGVTLEGYREAIRSFAAKWTLPVIEGKAGMGISQGNVLSLTTDGLHPNDAGHARMGRRVAGALAAWG